jgi:hypothetical protein
MIKIRIGNREENILSVSEGWINQQINGRKADGSTPCVQVTIKTDHLNMKLSTPSCMNVIGSGRAPNEYERHVFDLWQKCGLNNNDFQGGNIIAFLKQVQQRYS